MPGRPTTILSPRLLPGHAMAAAAAAGRVSLPGGSPAADAPETAVEQNTITEFQSTVTETATEMEPALAEPVPIGNAGSATSTATRDAAISPTTRTFTARLSVLRVSCSMRSNSTIRPKSPKDEKAKIFTTASRGDQKSRATYQKRYGRPTAGGFRQLLST